MADLENANPTILSVSQLPSRRHKGAAARHGPDARCDSIVYPRQPWPYGSGSSEDEDEDGDEPMDEQDIYGKPPASHSSRNHVHRDLPFLLFLSPQRECGIPQLTFHRPHLHHLRPRAPPYAGPVVCREAPGYPCEPLCRVARPRVPRHGPGGTHADRQPLLASHRHRPRGAVQARTDPPPQLSRGCQNEGRYPRPGRPGHQAAGRQGASRRRAGE